MAKRSMASLLPRYNASRMLGEYVAEVLPAGVAPGPPLHRATATKRRSSVAAWKARVRAAWPGVSAAARWTRRARASSSARALPVEVAREAERPRARGRLRRAAALARRCAKRAPVAAQPRAPRRRRGDGGEQRFRIDLKPGLAGRLDYRIRVYPAQRALLTHPFELGSDADLGFNEQRRASAPRARRDW